MEKYTRRDLMKISKKISILLSLSLIFGVSSANLATAAPSKTQKTTTAVKKDTYEIHKIKGSKFLSNIEKRLKSAKNTDKFPVIITFQSSDHSNNLQKVKNMIPTFTPKHVYQNLPAVSTTLSKEQINKLATIPQVIQIEYDEPIKAFSNSANSWYGTAKARTDFGVTGDLDGLPNTYSKTDATIAVIDTGVDRNHVDLQGKIIGWKDYVNNQPLPYDDNGHGTHVAGIAAGAGKGNSAYTGVAPGASIVGIKVLNQNGSGNLSNVVAAIDWAITNKNTYGIDIINLSLGTSGSSDGNDSASLAVNRAHQAGILVVVAAGNSGPGRQTIGSPAAATYAFTVGAMADPSDRGFFLASFSSRGTTADGRVKPDIVAPGYNITAPRANTSNGYVSYSGTSMASPFVAGTAALIQDANPTLTPTQIKSMMTTTAVEFGPSGKDIDYGFGNLRGYEAIKFAGNFNGTGPALPNRLFGSNSINTSKYKDEWTFDVTSTSYPIAITMIMPNHLPSQDFDIYLYAPNGTLVASSLGTSRQETIAFQPSQTGKYKLRVSSYSGTGSYFFDISAKGANLSLVVNDQP
jgi:serine protease AprX